MYKTKKGLANYLVMADIQAREGFKYNTEHDLKAHFGDEIKTRVNMLIDDLNAMAIYNKINKGSWERTLKTLKKILKNVFLGFVIQDEIIRLWGFKL